MSDDRQCLSTVKIPVHPSPFPWDGPDSELQPVLHFRSWVVHLVSPLHFYLSVYRYFGVSRRGLFLFLQAEESYLNLITV